MHFKSNLGECHKLNIAKREEAARQLLTHVAEMESVYLESANVVTVIAGDFNTDPDGRPFRSGTNLAILREKFVWSWENVPLSERVTNPATGRYSDACFDGFLVRGANISPARLCLFEELAIIFLSCSRLPRTDPLVGYSPTNYNSTASIR